MFRKIRNCLLRRRQLIETAQLFTALFEQSSPMSITHLDGSFLRVNQAFADMLGYSIEQLSQMTVYDVTNQADIGTTYDLLQQARQGTINQAQFEKQFVTSDGDVRDCLVTSSRVKSREYVITHVFDITERKEAEETIYHLAYYDIMTGLPNRTHFAEHAEHVFERARRDEQRATLLLVDLDNFKNLNDSNGHEFGDKILSAASEKFAELTSEYCRAANKDEQCSCFCARLGGDEFVFLCQNISDAAEAEKLAQRLHEKFAKPFIIDQQYAHITLSIGIALFPYDGSTVSSLLKAADLALYKAKDIGRGNYCFHESSQSTRIEQYLEQERALRYFIDTNDFQVHYQPLIRISDGAVLGAEALFRADENRYKNLDISRIMEIAEDTNLIVQLGKQILCKACEQCKIIRQQLLPNFKIAVNVSTRQLQDQQFIDMVQYTLATYQLPPQALEIEVTETSFFSNFDVGLEKIKRLRELGVGISIDDFGRGYSSMTYIRHIPATTMKIDKEFLDDIATDQKSKEIVKGLNKMAKTLGMLSCAEGVETEQQLNVLSQLGVDVAQGYLLGKPSTPEQLHQLLEK